MNFWIFMKFFYYSHFKLYISWMSCNAVICKFCCPRKLLMHWNQNKVMQTSFWSFNKFISIYQFSISDYVLLNDFRPCQLWHNLLFTSCFWQPTQKVFFWTALEHAILAVLLLFPTDGFLISSLCSLLFILFFHSWWKVGI